MLIMHGATHRKKKFSISYFFNKILLQLNEKEDIYKAKYVKFEIQNGDQSRSRCVISPYLEKWWGIQKWIYTQSLKPKMKDWNPNLGEKDL